jgi:hypothetical protein
MQLVGICLRLTNEERNIHVLPLYYMVLVDEHHSIVEKSAALQRFFLSSLFIYTYLLN